MTTRVGRLGGALVLAAAVAVTVVVYADRLPVALPAGLGTDILFVAVLLAIAGAGLAQLETFLTPTPGRIATTAALLAFAGTALGYAPPTTYAGAVGLLVIGAILRYAEVIGGAIR